MNLDRLDIPKNKIKQFMSKGICTLEDLVRYFPRKYYDFRRPVLIRNVQDGEVVAVVGTIQDIKQGDKYVRAKVSDGTGYLYVTWFQQHYVAKQLETGKEYIFCGKINIDPEYRSKQMLPMFFSRDIDKLKSIIPVYPKIPGMSDDYLKQSIQSALALMKNCEHLEQEIVRKFSLMKWSDAVRAIHQPKDFHVLKKAQERIVFDELFEYAMQMYEVEEENQTRSPFVMKQFQEVGELLKKLPFELTEGQRQTLRAISVQMKHGKRVNALLQGDVGCGKSIVAFLLMFVAAENGYQSAMMAPTQVLAKQHYEELSKLIDGTPYRAAYLSSEMKARERKNILNEIREGNVQFIIGTHAVLQEDVVIPKLALTIVDEEHRFGVVQRNQLKNKAKEGVHHITMSATPIPRSLALAIWGNAKEIYTIKTMPKGRKPVKTVLLNDERRVYNGIYQQIRQGHQCYVVCPLIEDSDAESMQDVDSVETTYEKMTRYFAQYPEVKIEMISGKMKQEEIDAAIERFARNEVNVLVSTTIIEVGVNVPNATMIVIKNAERFGLAQLHQLRGRVGRSDFQSYCVLFSEDKDNPKLKAMVETTDGFVIAQKDLELRGAGDFIGTKQSGQNKYVMLMMSNLPLYIKIKEEVKQIYQDPKRLSNYRYLNILD